MKETTEPMGSFETMQQEPWHLGKDAKPDSVIQSNVWECAPMQVIKQSEHGRTSATNKQKWSPFRQTMINS